MKKLHKYGDVHVTEEFLALPEVKEIRAKYKYVGFTVLIIMEMALSERKNTIGRISRLRPISHEVGVQLKTLLDIMNNCSMFVMDYAHDIVYMPRLRKKFHLPIEPSEEEIADICNKGNLYFGYAGKDAGASSKSNKNMKKSSERFEIVLPQSADNQDASVSSLKNKNKELKDKDINKEVDDADEDKFKEILSSPSWVRSVKKRHGVDLEDEYTLGVFAQWMFDYCCANDKKLTGRSDLRQYANNLLRRGTKTRADFDEYLNNCANEKLAQQYAYEIQDDDAPAVDYEHVEDGVRYTCMGQIVPYDAKKQPLPGMIYSYIREEWVEPSDYDPVSEKQAYERKLTEIPGYIKREEDVA